MDVLHEVGQVVRICQESPDEDGALAGVCGSVRERLGAATVLVWDGTPPGVALAAAGSAATSSCAAAQRAVDTGLCIPPTRSGAYYEAAAPVVYAGAPIGALAARWTIDATIDPARATPLLVAAATACAPTVRLALDRRRTPPVPARPGDVLILGVSPAIEEIRRAITRAAMAPFAVLIEGESGAGKELVARAIHAQSPRRDRRFCALNCAALSDDLIEAELFGHAKGSFTGALTERIGLFEEANAGTLFLDEVGELAPRAQAKLLRAIQEGEIRRVGENFPRRVDVRLVTATNRSLADEVAASRFRHDLLYRLDVLRIRVPALRERLDDIAVLAAHFWNQATARLGCRALLDGDTLSALVRYDWPGNVRELQNVIAALAVRAPRRGRVGPALLPESVARADPSPQAATLDGARRSFEARFVRAALARAGGHRGRAAAELGLTRQGLTKLMARLGIP
jgi:transcriptional regulator with GAF, ATPase, and Fis domain